MTASKLRRVIVSGVCLVAWLVGLGITWMWFELWRSAADPSGSIELADLSGPVRVYSDTFGIPHVFADTEPDALRALGFLHASDRLWQMEGFRRIAAGRLSEVFGAPALATDRFVFEGFLPARAPARWVPMKPPGRPLRVFPRPSAGESRHTYRA